MDHGTVISTPEGPSTRRFSFVIDRDNMVKRGQFVQLKMGSGQLIGRVSDVRKTNRYFGNPESVQNVTKPIDESYPTWEWECLVADAVAMGVWTGGGFQDSLFPPSPGAKVSEPDPAILKQFFGLDEKGLHMGNMLNHELEVKLSPTRLLQKHMAILAQSGAGKSFLAGGLIEELLDRPEGLGQIAIIVIDTHGEYISFADDHGYAAKTRVFPLPEMMIGMHNLTSQQLEGYARLSGPQARELEKIMSGMKGSYGPADLLERIKSSQDTKAQTKDILLSVVEGLAKTGLFGASDSPMPEDLARQGGLSIVDMSETIDLRKKQIVVSYLAKRLFDARRKGLIPPFLLLLEEAHQYVPEKVSREHALSRGIIQTIAREGRKFNAALCLISQRPVQLSTTVLSQCNTQVILRVTNPYDLKHIGESSEGITKDVLDRISSLQVGTGLVVGEAVNFPLFVKIRQRRSKESEKGLPMEKAAIAFRQQAEQRKEDAKQFM
jgi:DNA helicase HerA-like ATPase